MKSIEELKAEKRILKDEQEELTDRLEEVNYKLEALQEKIDNYELFKQRERQCEYMKKIRKWVCGENDTIDCYYSGVVCPDLNLYHYPEKGHPVGSNEEIAELLKEGGFKMLIFETKFVPAWTWGDLEIYYNFYENLY